MIDWTDGFLAKFDVAEFLNVGSCSRKVGYCQLEQRKSCDKFRPGKLLNLIFKISTMTLRVNEVNESWFILPKKQQKGCQLI